MVGLSSKLGLFRRSVGCKSMVQGRRESLGTAETDPAMGAAQDIAVDSCCKAGPSSGVGIPAWNLCLEQGNARLADWNSVSLEYPAYS